MAQNITSPVGRLIQGSLYKPQTTDDNGQPLVYKSGSMAGQPRSNYFFALAIPKGQEQHWSQTPWGQQIWNEGHAAGAQFVNLPGFAWKIIDGDSTLPDQKGKRWCDKENFPGHWVIRFGGSYAPKIYGMENGGFVLHQEPDFIKPGYYVQVAFSCEFNGDSRRPGMYMNHSMVCLSGYGPEIVYGPDVNEAGFGKAPLPAGASAVPVGAASMPAQAAPAAPANVTPNHAFVANAAAAPAAPPAPPPAPAAPARQMTAAATATYEQYLAAGWTDAQLIANGLMLP